MKFWSTQTDIEAAYKKGYDEGRRAVMLETDAKMTIKAATALDDCFEYMRLGEFEAALDTYARVESYRAESARLFEQYITRRTVG